MNAQMFLVVITFLTAAALALGANVPNSPSNQPQPSQLLIASGPQNSGPYAGPQQIPGRPEPGKDAVGDSNDLKADGTVFFGFGYPSYYNRYNRYGGYRSPYYGGGGYYGNYGGYYGNYGYGAYPYYGGW